jgi:hypothetical protein
MIRCSWMPPGSAGHFDRQTGDLGLCLGCGRHFCKTPILTVFVQSYTEVYNLRTNKFYKYFLPFRWLRSKFAKDEHYELSVEPRNYDVGKCSLMSNLFPPPEGRDRTNSEKERDTADKERIKRGASVLLTGTITGGVLDDIMTQGQRTLTC